MMWLFETPRRRVAMGFACCVLTIALMALSLAIGSVGLALINAALFGANIVIIIINAALPEAAP